MAKHSVKPIKKGVSELALLGGRPAFKDALHVGRPNIGSRQAFVRRVDDILERRWLTNGGYYVDEFERRLAEFIGVKHCIATCNATVALEILFRAFDLKGEVIVPSFTFVASVHALQWQRITPIFCDIDPRTHNINPSKVEELITPRTRGILGIHLWGRPCEVDTLQAIADRHHLKLFFDAAHAFGGRYGERRIGGFGCAEILSFHATKIVNAGEGGAVVTDDGDLAARIRAMKNFGFSRFDRVTSIGTNGKMSELSAAMGLTNFESFDKFIRANRLNFETYKDKLDGIRGLTLLGYSEAHSPNYHYVVAEISAQEMGLSRDELLSVLHAENVLARRYFYPGVHRMEPYCSLFPEARSLLPCTEALAGRVIVLPTGTAVSPPDIAKICALIRAASAQSSKIRDALAQRRTK